MNYEESLQYINQLNSRGISLGLERITALLEFLGNPQDTLHCIHVAGTNGKGSVCAFLDSVLQKAGLTVGRYISPTLYDYRERMQINGQWIAEDDLASVLTAVRAACDRMAEQSMELPTVFEVETAAAFLYFQQNAVLLVGQLCLAYRREHLCRLVYDGVNIHICCWDNHILQCGRNFNIKAFRSGHSKQMCQFKHGCTAAVAGSCQLYVFIGQL